ncbi:MAG: hypothetical protein HY661_04695 [Betaproteobacteria bacterium]|nr:hypothetical protein [Betaproteobacteria bacterium]
MLPDSKAVSASQLAHEFFGILDRGNSNLDRPRLSRHGVDETRFREETFYLKAFAVYYATYVTLGESPKGSALRTAFMGIWDQAARTSPEEMRSYNEFFRRIYLYAQAKAAERSALAGQSTDRISGQFANLLGAGKDPSLSALYASYASDCFATTSKSVTGILKENRFAS